MSKTTVSMVKKFHEKLRYIFCKDAVPPIKISECSGNWIDDKICTIWVTKQLQ